MKQLAHTSIVILLGFIIGGTLSCKSDPRSALVGDTFSAMEAGDAEALGAALGLGGSTPEVEALLVNVKKTFGDIRPKNVWDEKREFYGAISLGQISLAPGKTDSGSGRPFIGSTGEEGGMMIGFAGTTPCSFSVEVKLEATSPTPK